MTPLERKRLRQSRYRTSTKGKAAQARYRATERGKRMVERDNTHRIAVGREYLGRAQTPEQAEAINAYAKERVREFIARRAAGYGAAPMPSPTDNFEDRNGR